MRVMASMSMVLNLDKCIGCSTCSVTCKQTWTNRDGTDYVWFNNVETKPGVGYPGGWEDQARWRGGWEIDSAGRLRLRSGGRLRRLSRIFANPEMPSIDDYYEPATYDFDTLLSAPASDKMPVARPLSAHTGQPMDITSGPNWDDDLAGSSKYAADDPNLRAMEARTKGLGEAVRLEFEKTFMFHLPRLCEHCLNPACVAACPSGAMYKRESDGIVLVDENKCRGWRMCVSGCPYKKVFLNRLSGKAEKCTFCFPRVEEGTPTVCSETCVGRIRYIGVILYDLDAVEDAAKADAAHLVEAQRSVFLDPFDPAVIAQAEADGIARDWIQAAQASPIWALAMKHKVALPLHPEFRTLPMVWYIPPLSPVLNATTAMGGDTESTDDVFHSIGSLRVPIEYLAELFTAGDTAMVEAALTKLAAIRSHMRVVTTGAGEDLLPAGTSAEDLEELYRLLGVAKIKDRFVIPRAHREEAAEVASWVSGCPLESPDGPLTRSERGRKLP